jgi:prophage regulatory protein
MQKNLNQKTLGFLRLPQIVGNPRANPPIPPLVPVGKSTWWLWVKQGKAPQPVKLAEHTTVWRLSDIEAFIESFNPACEKRG